MTTDVRIFKAMSPAKLNLSFNILGVMPDGFHEVETLMQAIDLEDDLRFTIVPSDTVDVQMAFAEDSSYRDKNFPLDDKNLIDRAIRLFLKHMGTDGLAVSVEVRKVIPLAAGMGGGSSNAASTLMVLNRYFNSPFTKTKLEEIASGLGSDVPFFIHGGAQIGRHRGERLTSLPSAEKMYFVVVKPRQISIATPWIYKAYDAYIAINKSVVEVDLKSACSAREDGNVPLAAKSFANVFEGIVLEYYPSMNFVRERLLALGGVGCCMTGSGPTMFALCDSAKSAAQILKDIKSFEIPALRNTDGGGISLEAWAAETIDRGPTVMEISPHSVRQRR